MEQIRVQNLRCLEDTELVTIKPITVLVGANSSGKSTFLRVFPLLRQSSETRTLSGLLLNEGEVNFGFFPDAVHRDANPSEMKLQFRFTLKRGILHGATVNRFLHEPLPVDCEVTYARRGKDQKYPYLKGLCLRFGLNYSEDVIEIKADEEGKILSYFVNKHGLAEEQLRLRLHVGRGLIPTLIPVLDGKDGAVAALEDDGLELDRFDQRLLFDTYDWFHGRTGLDTRLAIFRSVLIGSPQRMLTDLQRATGVGSWDQRTARWTVESPEFIWLRNLLLVRVAPQLLGSVNAYVSQLASSVQYFRPVRASVERDYLSRDVAVGSVDPSGLNVAMVLASLSSNALSKFRSWMLTHFGFEVYPQGVGDGARIALRMKELNAVNEFNLADMGFGFSQMLPFLVQLWNIIENEPSRSRIRFSPRFDPSMQAFPQSYIIAIEQPELHLHPALQAKLADLFVAMAVLSQQRGVPVRFILETHSPTIIERIGTLIEQSKLSAQDVQILLFERNQGAGKPNSAAIRHAEFDADGVLKNWPFGFLTSSFSS